MKINAGGRRRKARDDFLGSRLDQGMMAIGLVAEQVVDKEVTGRAVQPRVEMERALPAPDVELGLVPDGRAAGKLASHLAQDDPLPAPLVANRQFLRRHEQVVANLEEQRSIRSLLRPGAPRSTPGTTDRRRPRSPLGIRSGCVCGDGLPGRRSAAASVK